MQSSTSQYAWEFRSVIVWRNKTQPHPVQSTQVKKAAPRPSPSHSCPMRAWRSSGCASMYLHQSCQKRRQSSRTSCQTIERGITYRLPLQMSCFIESVAVSSPFLPLLMMKRHFPCRFLHLLHSCCAPRAATGGQVHRIIQKLV